MLGDRFGQADEGGQSAAGGARAEAVDQDADVERVEGVVEDRAERFFEGVGAPDGAAGAFEFAQRRGLGAGVILRVLQQRPAGVFEALGGGRVVVGAQRVSVVAADLV